mmetsp:Transcript_17500/g.41658  ORF Transcript_17500/g.41658 Transcript_17500/m.41658 type:complete len:82 (-) Transcript_17500:1114-1359(-)
MQADTAISDMVGAVISEKLKTVELLAEITSLSGRRKGSVVVVPSNESNPLGGVTVASLKASLNDAPPQPQPSTARSLLKFV